jgi:kinesin family protein 11
LGEYSQRNLQATELSNLQDFAGFVKSELTTHMETIATNHIDAHKNIRSIGIPSSEDMKGLRSNRYHSILKIKEAGRCFVYEYKVRSSGT